MSRSLLLAAALLLALASSASALFDWGEMSNMSSKQTGDATFYGHDPDQVKKAEAATGAAVVSFFARLGNSFFFFFFFSPLSLPLLPLSQTQKTETQDAKGACSFNENFANTMSSSSWTTGTMVTIAMNHDQFNGGRGCGTCIMYRGIGGGVGVTPLSTTQWTMGIVNNQCPECHKGSIDQNINGDGRWNVEWFAVPCNVGDGKIKYSRIDNLGAEYWALVVSNTRVPVKSLQIKIDGEFEFCFVFFVFCFFGGVFLEFWRGKLSFSPSPKIFFLPQTFTKTLTVFTSLRRLLHLSLFPSPRNHLHPNQTPLGAWHTPHYTTNNQWVWPGESVNRRWSESDFPMPVRVTSVTGETVEDVIPKGGGDGTKQFKPVGSLVFESQIMPGYGKRANNYGAFVHPAVPAGLAMWNPETPKNAIGTEANSGKTYAAATMYIQDGEQCGGLAGVCQPRDVGQPTKPCIASQWPLAVCESSASICLPSEGEGVQGGNSKDSKIFRCVPKNAGRQVGGGEGAPAAASSTPSSSTSSVSTASIATGGRKLLA